MLFLSLLMFGSMGSNVCQVTICTLVGPNLLFPSHYYIAIPKCQAFIWCMSVESRIPFIPLNGPIRDTDMHLKTPTYMIQVKLSMNSRTFRLDGELIDGDACLFLFRSNLLRPSGVTLQPALFSLKVFMAEDLPQSKDTCFKRQPLELLHAQFPRKSQIQ